MSFIVGVHGIGQQQSGRHQLLATWSQAALDGLERASGQRWVAPLSLDIAFYGDLFLPPVHVGSKRRTESAFTPSLLLAEELSAEELLEFESAVLEAVGPATLEDVENLPTPKGYTRAPAPVRVLVRVVDHVFGPGTAVILLGVFRQVKRYLSDVGVKRLVDDRVAAAVGADTKIILGHSLGSVVAFDYVRRHPETGISLITLGSPLGFRFVRELLADTDLPLSLDWLADISAWTNVRDPRDVVACAGDLSRWWPCAADARVDNGGDAHAVTRYLGKAATGAAIMSMTERSE